MKKIGKNNYKHFLNYYSDFHDGYIKQIDYIDEMSKIKIIFEVWPLGKPTLQDKGTFEEKQVKLKMLFTNINSFSENNPYMINHIDYTHIDFYSQNGKNLICFSLNAEDPDEKPYLYIICEEVEYEEIK